MPEPQVVHTLRSKRDEIEGIIIAYERTLEQARRGLAHVSATLAIFKSTQAGSQVKAYTDRRRFAEARREQQAMNEALSAFPGRGSCSPARPLEAVDSIGIRKEIIPLDEGDLIITFPEGLSATEGGFLLQSGMPRLRVTPSTAFILAVLLIVAQAQSDTPAWAQSDTSKTAPQDISRLIPGRYQIVFSPLLARDAFLLDTATGQVWQLVKGAKGDELWEPMSRSDSRKAERDFEEWLGTKPK